MNYEEDMRIDETSLDIEWLNQASLGMKYIRHFAECRRTLTLAEEKIKVIRAELIAEANANPVTCCDKEKPNAADIEAYYRNHDRHKKAKSEWVEAQFELDIAEGAKSEITFTRKAALENLVQLHGQSYFAGPSVPHDLTALRAEKEKRTNTGVAAKLNLKRTK